jgi:N-dimethylarginine dimethylaminohydrolase
MTEKWTVKPRSWSIEARMAELWRPNEREEHREIYKELGIYQGAVLTDGETELFVDPSRVDEMLSSLNEFGNLWQKK